MPAKIPKLSATAGIRLYYGRAFVFGPGRAALLEEIERTGSISEAAKAMAMSYMKAAGNSSKACNPVSSSPSCSERREGGSTRGGATLSPTGRAALAQYREMEASSQRALQRASRRFTRLLG